MDDSILNAKIFYIRNGDSCICEIGVTINEILHQLIVCVREFVRQTRILPEFIIIMNASMTRILNYLFICFDEVLLC